MVLRKTKLGYIVTAVFMFFIVSGIFINSALMSFLPSEGRLPYIAALTVIMLLFSGVIALLISRLFSLRPAKQGALSAPGVFFNAVMVLLVFSAAIALRIYILYSENLQIHGNTLLYEKAMVGGKVILPEDMSLFSYIYCMVLRLVLFFTGNFPVVAASFQIVLQMIALLLLYCAVRMMTGRIASIMAACIAAFYPILTEDVTALDENIVLIMIFSLELLILAFFVRGIAKWKYNGFKWIVWIILVGAVCGAAFCVHSITAILMVIPIAALWMDNTDWKNSLKYVLTVIIVAVLTVILVYIAAYGWNADVYFLKWITGSFCVPETVPGIWLDGNNKIWSMAAGLLLFAAAVSFIFVREFDILTPWMIIFILNALIAPYMGAAGIENTGIYDILMAIVAGCGIANLTVYYNKFRASVIEPEAEEEIHQSEIPSNTTYFFNDSSEKCLSIKPDISLMQTEEEKKAESEDNSEADREQPLSDKNEPEAENNRQVAGREQPLSDKNEPEAENNRQVAGREQPLSDKNEPEADNNRQVADREQPLESHEPANTDKDIDKDKIADKRKPLQKRQRFVPEGMVLPMGEEEIDEYAEPHMKMPEADKIGIIEVRKNINCGDRNGKAGIDNRNVTARKDDFDIDTDCKDDFDL